MTRLLFLFLDGVGLGADDPAANPLAAAELPTLTAALAGRRPLANAPRLATNAALFIPTDATLGVAGLPQSATGQATLLTGRNVSAEIGGHWGPKPNAAVAAVLRAGSFFHELRAAGKPAALLSGYPQRYFDSIASGKRSYSAIPLAATAAGLTLAGEAEIRRGQALGADFTNAFWRSELDTDVPVYTPREAGQRLSRAAQAYDFALFEHWITDYIGHRGSLSDGIAVMEQFDQVLAGVLDEWDLDRDLVVITSDHGNLEDLTHRHHTYNRVPTLVLGARHAAFDDVQDLTGLVPAMRRALWH